MKTTNLILAVLIGFAVGVVLGSGGLHQLTKEEGAKLREQIQQREHRIDSLHTVTQQLTDSLKRANKTTVIEKIKYYEIKPKSNSVPYLDSMFRARYR